MAPAKASAVKVAFLAAVFLLALAGLGSCQNHVFTVGKPEIVSHAVP